MRRLFGTVFLLLSWSFISNAQTGLWYHHWDITDGLPTMNVINTLLDSRGFLWVGTLDGICRFDSFTFECVRAQDQQPVQLPSSQTNFILESPDQNIWVSTRFGIGVIDPVTLNVTKTFEMGNEDTTWRLVQKDSLVVGISLESWLAFNPEAELVSQRKFGEEHLPFLISPSLATRKQGNSRYLYRIEIENNFSFKDSVEIVWDEYAVPEDQFEYHPTWANDSTQYYFSAEGEVFENIINLNTGQVSTTKIAEGLTQLLTFPKYSFAQNGSFWVGASPVLYHFQKKKDGSFIVTEVDPSAGQDFERKANDFTNLNLDRFGRLWMGDNSTGLSMLETRQLAFKYLNIQHNELENLSSPVVWNLAETKSGDVLLGTGNGAIKFTFNKSQKFGEYTFLESAIKKMSLYRGTGDYHNTVNVVPLDTGFYYSVLYDGIYRVNEFSESTKIFPNEKISEQTRNQKKIMSYDWIDDHTILWGSYLTLIYHNTATDEFNVLDTSPEPDSIRLYNVLDIEIENIDSENWNAWLGTGFGLQKYESASKKLSIHFPKDSLSERKGKTIMSLQLKPDSTFWSGYIEKGVEVWNPAANTLTVYNESNGLANESIWGIVTDQKGRVWVSHNKGISCIKPETGEILNFLHQDGLRMSEFNQNAYAQLSNGYIGFGGHGAVFFHPDTVLAIKETTPELVLNRLHFNKLTAGSEKDKFLIEEDELNISYDNNTFEIGFTELDFSFTENVQYSYQLTGSSTDWIDTSPAVRKAFFTGLNPGEYTLKIRTKRGTNPWVTVRELGIRVIPPFWLTKWFISTSVLFGFVFIGFVAMKVSGIWYRKRIRNLEKEQKILTEREHLSRDLHDSIGSQLSLIARHLEQVESTENNESKVRLEAANQTARFTISQLRETLWALKNEKVQLSRFSERLVSLIGRMTTGTGIKVVPVINIRHDRKLHPIVILHAFRMIQEITNNAIKYSEATELRIRINSFNRKDWSIMVSDNGKGFDLDRIERRESYGLKHIKERAEEIDAIVQIESIEKRGTTVSLVFRGNG